MSCICQKIQPTGEQFACSCDRFEHPPGLNIGAGLRELPRQIAGFPAFRRAMLSDLRGKAPLGFWRARGEDDLGLMLLEMWAYVCDVLSFYDKAIAQEAYLGTANLRPSLRRMVALLGYLPRPAVAATVRLAALADGRLPFALPAGTAFRSGSFNGNPPQVFELGENTTIHPLTNRWNIKAPHPGIIQTDNPSFLLIQAQANLQPDSLVLLIDTRNDERTQALRILKAAPHTGRDGHRYTKVEFHSAARLPAGFPLSRLRLMIPNLSAALWTASSGNLSNQADIEEESSFPVSTVATFQETAASVSASFKLTLDSIYKQISAGDYILIEKSKREARWFKVISVTDALQQIDTAAFLTTRLTLDVTLNHVDRKLSTESNWGLFDNPHLRVHYGMTPAGLIVDEAKTNLSPTDPLEFDGQVEAPENGYRPTHFFLSDKNMRGLAVSGDIDFQKSVPQFYPSEKWTPDLSLPVEVFGNIIHASRGETVRNEKLGSGNASLANQTFKLKKKPLTYLLAPAAANDMSIQSTLRLYVDGVRWKEVASFYGRHAEDEVYIIRQNDEGDSFVTFGDGIRGRRLPTGVDNVVAYYRYGAGQASPPANSITQIETPVPGLGSIRNPMPAAGGADAEGPEQLRTHAPKSALILGRAISRADMEAVVLSMPGVRAVQTAWYWHGVRQQAVAQIWYIGESGIEDKVKSRLRAVTDPSTPIDVKPATAVPATLVLDMATDPRYFAEGVLTAVRQALTDRENGLLAPENVGIGKPLFRSSIFEQALSVEGAMGVRAVFWNAQPFGEYAKTPGAGHYFDFEQGALQLK